MLAFAIAVTGEPAAQVEWQLSYLHGRFAERLASDTVQRDEQVGLRVHRRVPQRTQIERIPMRAEQQYF